MKPFDRSRSFRCAALNVLAYCFCLPALALAQSKNTKQFSFTVPAEVSVRIVNISGNIYVRPGSANTVTIQASSSSAEVQVDAQHSGGNIQVGSDDADARIDYDVTVPQSATVAVDDESGQVRIENLRGNVKVSGESPEVRLRDLADSTISVHTVDGSVTVSNVHHSRVEVTTSSGRVQLESVSGPQVTVRSTSGTIRFTGMPGEDGSYKLANHSADIELILPQDVAAEVAARSVQGAVTSEFAFAKDDHLGFQPVDGKALGGLLNGGGASVDVHSFSGTIRVKRQ